jgi:hypothetical protein
LKSRQIAQPLCGTGNRVQSAANLTNIKADDGRNSKMVVSKSNHKVLKGVLAEYEEAQSIANMS